MRSETAPAGRLLATLAAFLLLTGATALAPAPASDEAGAREQPAPEPYSFSYSAESAGGLSTHQETGDGSGRVTGFYTIMGEDGRQRRVDYVADAEGYRAKVSTNEVGTRNENTADAQYDVQLPSAGQLQAAKVSLEEYKYLEETQVAARQRNLAAHRGRSGSDSGSGSASGGNNNSAAQQILIKQQVARQRQLASGSTSAAERGSRGEQSEPVLESAPLVGQVEKSGQQQTTSAGQSTNLVASSASSTGGQEGNSFNQDNSQSWRQRDALNIQPTFDQASGVPGPAASGRGNWRNQQRDQRSNSFLTTAEISAGSQVSASQAAETAQDSYQELEQQRPAIQQQQQQQQQKWQQSVSRAPRPSGSWTGGSKGGGAAGQPTRRPFVTVLQQQMEQQFLQQANTDQDYPRQGVQQAANKQATSATMVQVNDQTSQYQAAQRPAGQEQQALAPQQAINGGRGQVGVLNSYETTNEVREVTAQKQLQPAQVWPPSGSGVQIQDSAAYQQRPEQQVSGIARGEQQVRPATGNGDISGQPETGPEFSQFNLAQSNISSDQASNEERVVEPVLAGNVDTQTKDEGAQLAGEPEVREPEQQQQAAQADQQAPERVETGNRPSNTSSSNQAIGNFLSMNPSDTLPDDKPRGPEARQEVSLVSSERPAQQAVATGLGDLSQGTQAAPQEQAQGGSLEQVGALEISDRAPQPPINGKPDRQRAQQVAGGQNERIVIDSQVTELRPEQQEEEQEQEQDQRVSGQQEQEEQPQQPALEVQRTRPNSVNQIIESFTNRPTVATSGPQAEPIVTSAPVNQPMLTRQPTRGQVKGLIMRGSSTSTSTSTTTTTSTTTSTAAPTTSAQRVPEATTLAPIQPEEMTFVYGAPSSTTSVAPLPTSTVSSTTTTTSTTTTAAATRRPTTAQPEQAQRLPERKPSPLVGGTKGGRTSSKVNNLSPALVMRPLTASSKWTTSNETPKRPIVAPNYEPVPIRTTAAQSYTTTSTTVAPLQRAPIQRTNGATQQQQRKTQLPYMALREQANAFSSERTVAPVTTDAPEPAQTNSGVQYLAGDNISNKIEKQVARVEEQPLVNRPAGEPARRVQVEGKQQQQAWKGVKGQASSLSQRKFWAPSERAQSSDQSLTGASLRKPLSDAQATTNSSSPLVKRQLQRSTAQMASSSIKEGRGFGSRIGS